MTSHMYYAVMLFSEFVGVFQGRAAEEEWFRTNPVYRPLADRMGCKYLAHYLSNMLMEHIRDCLPVIRMKVSEQLLEVKKELGSYGENARNHLQKNSSLWNLAASFFVSLPSVVSILCGTDDLGAALLHIITRYSSDFSNAIDGRASDNLTTTELYGGAR